MLQKRDIRRAFNKSAAHYDKVAILQRQVADEMLQRLDMVKPEFLQILDAGCGTGYALADLSKRYPKARVLALDLADEMLRVSRARNRSALSLFNPLRRAPLYVCSDLEQLALADNSVDLVFSNLSLQWCNDFDKVMREWQRVLKPGGMLLFSSLGPDTLRELRDCWQTVDGKQHVHQFVDMHIVGDALLNAGFAEPVMDVDHYTLTYSDVMALMRDLKTLGASNALDTKSKALTGKRRLAQLAQAYEQYRVQQRLPATYEVVFGHAWKAQARTTQVNVSLDGLKHREN